MFLHIFWIISPKNLQIWKILCTFAQNYFCPGAQSLKIFWHNPINYLPYEKVHLWCLRLRVWSLSRWSWQRHCSRHSVWRVAWRLGMPSLWCRQKRFQPRWVILSPIFSPSFRLGISDAASILCNFVADASIQCELNHATITVSSPNDLTFRTI